MLKDPEIPRYTARRTHRTYTPEFKAELVAACLNPGASIAALARVTGDSTRDLPLHTLETVRRAFPHLNLEAEPTGDLAAMGQIFGEELPSGLVFHE